MGWKKIAILVAVSSVATVGLLLVAGYALFLFCLGAK